MDRMRRRQQEADDKGTQRRARRGLTGWQSFAFAMGGALISGALVWLLVRGRAANGGLAPFLFALVGIVIVALFTARPWRR